MSTTPPHVTTPTPATCYDCDGQAQSQRDDDGTQWDPCQACRTSFVTPYGLRAPTVRVLWPEDEEWHAARPRA